jgi:hypothetical protein
VGKVKAAGEVAGITRYAVTTTSHGSTLRFHHCREFRISTDLSNVQVCADATANEDLLSIPAGGSVSACLLALRDQTVLHTSAVLVDEPALAFIGPTGREESTLGTLVRDGGASAC